MNRKLKSIIRSRIFIAIVSAVLSAIASENPRSRPYVQAVVSVLPLVTSAAGE